MDGKCTCKWVKCPRHGKCKECIQHHKLNTTIPPWCQHPNRKKPKKTEPKVQ